MKPNERPFLREFNKSPFIKYPIKDTITTTSHKVSLLIQIQLGGIEQPNDKEFTAVRRQFSIEKAIIFERIQRLIRCVIDCKAFDCDSISTRHALDLSRSLSAEFWDYSNLQLRQLPQVGPVATRKLVSNNIHSIEELGKLDTATIERYMSKNPPFGRKTKDLIAGFPLLRLASEITGRASSKPGQNLKINVKVRLWYDNDEVPVWMNKKPSLTFMAETSNGSLVHFWRGNVAKLEKQWELKFTVELLGPDVNIKCWIACEEIVGTARSCVLNHNIPAAEFPVIASHLDAKTGTQKRGSKRIVIQNDEFGTDELEDNDMLAAVRHVEEAKSDYESDGFAELSDLEAAAAAGANKSKKVKAIATLEPFQMTNGKWACNHACRDGQLLKNGQPCKHLCCREGLDKPRKIKRKVRSRTGSANIN